MISMRLIASALAAALALTARQVDAMPPFAQAYGAKCTLCHLEVPALNTFGRYVQRSGYTALDHDKIRHISPVWLGFNPSYDSASEDLPHRLAFGNVAVHAVGAIGSDLTYHLQQWVSQNDRPGTLDTAWVSYNDLLHRNGHLFAGKIESPAPSPFSQWFDLASFALPEITVGEHQYELDANRWGARFAYVHPPVDAEAGYVGASDDGDNDKAFQWKLAYADPNHPGEAGLFGSRGSVPLSEGGTDQYHSLAAYVERDPIGGMPGFFAMYQRAFDANPGNGAPPTTSLAVTEEAYQTLFRGNAIVGIRHEFTNDGLGTTAQSGNLDFEYHLARFVHVYLETYVQQHQKPGYRYMLWWTAPL